MSARVRWIAFGVVLVVVLGLVALFVFNSDLTMSSDGEGARRTGMEQRERIESEGN